MTVQWRWIAIWAALLFPLFGTIGAQAYQVSYQYDLLNRLIAVEYKSTGRIEYTYDASGNRLTTQVFQILKGDINRDSLVNLTDAILALQIVVGVKPVAYITSDVNDDNRIGLADAIYILQRAAEVR